MYHRRFASFERYMSGDFGADSRAVAQGLWATLKRTAGRIPFVDEIVAAYVCSLDPKTPTRVRVVLMAALAYFVLPLDAIPDLLPALGFTDDIAVLAMAFSTAARHVTDEHRMAARDWFESRA